MAKKPATKKIAAKKTALKTKPAAPKLNPRDQLLAKEIAKRVSFALSSASETSFCLELHIAPEICVKTLPTKPTEGTRIELRALQSEVLKGFRFIVPAEKPLKIPLPDGTFREDLKLVPIDLQTGGMNPVKKTAHTETWDISAARQPANDDCT